MSLYLNPYKLDVATGSSFVFVLNEQDAQKKGLIAGDMVIVEGPNFEVAGAVDLTSTEVPEGSVGMFSDVWQRFSVSQNDIVEVNILHRPKSVDYIARKLNNYSLSEQEIDEIFNDISNHRLKDTEMAFFMATFFNPGFDEDETIYATKSMAKYGEILKFSEKFVVDKHSIGGTAGKGITPILVSIIAALGIPIPNTSSRAITSPAGTSDILETVMPISLTKEQIYEAIKKESGCLVWGGGLNLAPADDILIRVEKSLRTQSFQKVLMSVLAKKIATGITHLFIDIPYGVSVKVDTIEDADAYAKMFEKVAKEVGIQCVAKPRFIAGPDGRGVGPVLEMIEMLKVLEQTEDRSIDLEESALSMAGTLLEMIGYSDKGYDTAKEVLQSGKALEKFWRMAENQGAKKRMKSIDLKPGAFSYDVKSPVSGKIRSIDTKVIKKISKYLGTPGVKQAGLYFHKMQGESIKKGDVVVTLYSVDQDRVDSAVDVLDFGDLVVGAF